MALRNLLRPAEARSTSSGPYSLNDLWDRDILTSSTPSGVLVTQTNAMRGNAIFSAVHLISDSISMLPAGQYVKRGSARLPLYPRAVWLDQPDPDGIGRQSFLKQWLVSKLISHAACVRILRDGGEVVALQCVDPRRVVRHRDGAGRIFYTIDGRFRVEREDMIYDAELIPAGALMGVSRVDTLRDTFGLVQALEVFASSFFGNGAHTSGVIEMPDGTTIDNARDTRDLWNDTHRGANKANKTGVLAGGKWVKTSTDPDEAQMIESREFAISDIARAFRIPPAMLGSTRAGVQGYASREQDAQQFVTLTLLPYITAIEDHLSALVPGRDSFIKFTVDGLVRASLADRYAAHSSALDAGWSSMNEVRSKEDLAPVEGGDSLRVPLENIALSAAELVEMQKRVAMFQILTQSGVDPAAAAAAVGLPTMKHTGLPSVQLQKPDPEGTP